MDLILLQPGNQEIFGGQPGSLIGEKGDWRDKNVEGISDKPCIELVSIHQGMKQQVTTDVSNRARTSGRPIITEFTCTKYVDATSVKFYEYCLRAELLGKDKDITKIFICRNSGDAMANIITFSIKDALISEIQFQSHPDDMPTEQFKLNFTDISWEYTVQDVDMKRLGSVSAGWSLTENRPIGALGG